MSYKLPTLYKKTLLLAVVFGPIFWLMFTDDGQRRTDTMVLWLFGEAEIKMDLAALDGQFTEAELKKVYPDLAWQCQMRQSSYGDYLCFSRIGVFNGIPANYLTLFFASGHIRALKLRYRENNHHQLLSHLRGQLGRPDDEARASVTAPDPDEVLSWTTPYGLVVVKRQLRTEEQPALFWLAADLIGR